ncbi:MAG TPA: hypothetical protein DF383_06910, partial [Deltaproteobacteria bacterium]|nr:hypothetical protein [Deltaproteobacteria bacterium]
MKSRSGTALAVQYVESRHAHRGLTASTIKACGALLVGDIRLTGRASLAIIAVKIAFIVDFTGKIAPSDTGKHTLRIEFF